MLQGWLNFGIRTDRAACDVREHLHYASELLFERQAASLVGLVQASGLGSVRVTRSVLVAYV